MTFDCVAGVVDDVDQHNTRHLLASLWAHFLSLDFNKWVTGVALWSLGPVLIHNQQVKAEARLIGQVKDLRSKRKEYLGLSSPSRFSPRADRWATPTFDALKSEKMKTER